MLKNLFGKKKEFFVELDDSKAPKQEEPVVTPEAPATVAETATEAPKPATTSKKTSVKSKTPSAQPAPALKVVAAPKKAEPTEVAFASKNVIIPTLARRTPGPSLDKYKEMARQTKMR